MEDTEAFMTRVFGPETDRIEEALIVIEYYQALVHALVEGDGSEMGTTYDPISREDQTPE